MFWSDLVFGQKQGGNYEKPSRVSRLAAGAADARLLRPRPRAGPRAGRESIDAARAREGSLSTLTSE